MSDGVTVTSLSASLLQKISAATDCVKPKIIAQVRKGKKVKFSLEQAMKAQRGSRGIALLFL